MTDTKPVPPTKPVPAKPPLKVSSLAAVVDDYASCAPSLLSPHHNNAVAITPSDSTWLNHASKTIVVGVSGNVKLDTLAGQIAVVVPFVAGIPLNIRATRIYATGTTATGIVVLY